MLRWRRRVPLQVRRESLGILDPGRDRPGDTATRSKVTTVLTGYCQRCVAIVGRPAFSSDRPGTSNDVAVVKRRWCAGSGRPAARWQGVPHAGGEGARFRSSAWAADPSADRERGADVRFFTWGESRARLLLPPSSRARAATRRRCCAEHAPGAPVARAESRPSSKTQDDGRRKSMRRCCRCARAHGS